MSGFSSLAIALVGGFGLSNMPGLPNIPAEMGGMRFLESQQNVYGLCTNELNLEVSSFNFANNIQYLRRHQFSFDDYPNPQKVQYFLTDEEKGNYPIDLVTNAIYNLVPEAKGLSGTKLTNIYVPCHLIS